MMRRALLVVACAVSLALAGTPASAQTRRAEAHASQNQAPQAPVTIKGRIFDKESGETMPYTNVYISGSNIGTMAFTDGFYIMRGLPPGTYTVRASYISYDVGEETVTLGPGEVVNLDFHLVVHAIMAQPFSVEAERALVEVDRTGSAHFLSSEAMEAMPLDQVVDMIALQPGVTLQDNEIHIRGGRADDTMFIVDGLSVNDPLAGGGYGYNIDPALINEVEVLTGGFNAEYGQAVSGVVNVSTKEGSDRLEGNFSVKRDYLLHTIPKNDYRGWDTLTDFTEAHNVDVLKGLLSGPDPISAGLRKLGINLPGKQYLLASASVDMRDGYLPIYSRQNRLESPIYTDRFWAPRQSNNWNGMLKWTWNMSTRRKFSVTASRNVIVSQGFSLPGEGYPMDFIDGLDRYLVFTNENILTQAYYREVISENSWFELTLGRNFSRMHNNVNGNDDFTTYEPYNGWDDNVGQNDILGQAEGSADRWHDHYVESYTAKGTYSFMGSTTNKFKTGFELSFTEMQLVDLQGKTGLPPAGRLATYEDMFRASPVTAAAFFQDTIEYRGLVVNAGIRADVWAPGPEVDYAMAHDDEFLWIDPDMAASYDDKTFSMFGRRWKGRISPRLGLSFPVTPKDKFFFNYGHFNQWPRFAYVYPQLQATTVTAIQLLGNPNLDPKVTVEYETGMQHEFDGLWSLGLTMFNRDIYGYAKSTRLNQVYIAAEDTPDPNDSSTLPVNPVRYFNGDSARSIGMELSIVKRTTRWLSGSASLELQRTTGTNSSADEAYLQARYSEYEEGDTIESSAALTRGPLIWDKPWAMSLNVDFSVFDKERPEIFGWRTPANWSANLLVTAESGQRYTPYLGFTNDDPINGKAIDGELNSAIGPYRSSVNLRLNKFWRYAGGGKVTVYLEARNIFNHKNYRRVNPWTGKGYELGDYNPTWSKNNEIGGVWADTNSEAYAKTVVNPSYIENPRLLLWGVSYSW